MASRVDSSNTGKALFKKRAHRPWKPALLETVIQNPAETLSIPEPLDLHSALNDTTPSFEEISRIYDQKIELIQQKMESTLEQKNKEKADIHQKLSSTEASRLTFGGFFQPKNIVFSDDNATLHKTANLMSELKEKEYEILELSNNLKLTQAQEQASRAQEALHAEIKGREAAEARAIYALNKAQQTADSCMLAEQKLALSEQNYGKLFHNATKMEEEFKSVLLERHQLIDNLENEVDARKQAEDQIKFLEHELQKQKQVESKNLELSQTLTHVDHARQKANEDINALNLRIKDLDHQLSTEKGRGLSLEKEIMVLQEKIAQLSLSKGNADDQNAKILLQIKKMNSLIMTERQLRRLYEEKTKEITSQVFALEMQLKTEEQTRQVAEEKAKQTMEQASKAMMRMLNLSPNA